MWWLSQLPRVLMATTSILLDERLFSRRHRGCHQPQKSELLHRLVLIQVLLWLTVSLPKESLLFLTSDVEHHHARGTSPFTVNMNGTTTNAIPMNDVTVPTNASFFLWMHLIFFNNILVVVAMLGIHNSGIRWLSYERDEDAKDNNNVQPLRRQRRRGYCWNYICSLLWCRGNIMVAVQSVLVLLSPCWWISMVWAYMDGPTNNDQISSNKYYHAAVVSSVMVLSGRFAWNKYRSFQRRQKIYNLLVSSSNTNDDNHHTPLEESLWYQWSVAQVLHWLALETQVMSVGTNDAYIPNDDKEEKEYLQTIILSRLAAERIDGSALQSLDHEALRHMDIPYGIACRLLDMIQRRLVSRYPRSRRLDVLNRDEHHIKSESPPNRRPMRSMLDQHDQDYGGPRQQRNSAESTNADPLLGGLDHNAQQRLRDQMQQRFGLEMPKIRTVDAQSPEASNGVPASDYSRPEDNDLVSLPPHIQEIVHRKPHLFDQLKAMHQEERQEIQQLAQSKLHDSSLHRSQQPPSSVNTADSTHETSLLPELLLQSMPPEVREVAERNPEVFQQMLRSRQPINHAPRRMEMVPEVDEENQQGVFPNHPPNLPQKNGPDYLEDEEATELTVLLPKDVGHGRLRQRPGF